VVGVRKTGGVKLKYQEKMKETQKKFRKGVEGLVETE